MNSKSRLIAIWFAATSVIMAGLYAAFAPEPYRDPPAEPEEVHRLLSKSYVPAFVIEPDYLRELDSRDARKRPRVVTTSGRSRRER